MKKNLYFLFISVLAFAYMDMYSQITLPYNQGFEGASSATYTTNTTSITGLSGMSYTTSTGGRLRTSAGSGFRRSGSRAITMDRNPSGSFVTNYFIMQLDLSNYTSSNLELDFWFTHHDDENHSQDRVWVRGSSTGAWVQIYNWYANRPNRGVWKNSGALDITTALANASPSQTVSSTFQIRFGQHDNFPATSPTGSDGFSVDDISINEVLPRDGSLTSVNTFCSGLSPVEVVLENLGADTIKKAKISWTMNGVTQTPALITGLSIPKGGQQVVSLGNYNFSGSSFTINARCDTINDSVDQNHSNDTIAKTQSLGMAGVYTIGGSSPDFTTFNAAKNALYSRGLCGSVVFNVRSGTYNERVYFNGSIQGASSAATIRFRPDPANTSPATLRYSSDYTLRFGGGASYVAFDSLNLETSFGNVVEMHSENNHISFNGNNIKGYNTSSTSNGYALFYLFNGKYTSNLTLENNKCQYGSYGIYAYNSYSGYTSTANMMDSIFIENNEFIDFSYQGIQMRGYKYVNITGNKIFHKSTGGYTYPYGVYLYYCDFIDIVSNEITTYNTTSTYSRALYLYYCDGSTGNRNLIANNMVSTPVQESTSSGSPDYIYYCNYSDIIYNSWYGKYMYTSSSYGMLRLYYGTSVNFSNNNMFNDGGTGYTIRIYGSPTEKNNNYYNTDASKRRYPTSGGTNNVSADPGFISSTNLHATGIGIYQKGDPFLGVTNDIDGDTRHISTPCIGADEFFIPARDASPKEVVYSPSCPGTKTISARIENKGLDTLTSFKVDWSVSTNGGSLVPKSQVSWSGVLPAGKDTVITLGNITMTGTDLYGVQVRTSSPNTSADQNIANDTTYKEIETAMSGTFTVGGLSPDFITPQAAAVTLKKKGLCGPVVFDIRPGTYTGNLVLEEIAGASSVNTITFKGTSRSNTTLSHGYSSGNYATVELKGGDYFRFKNLKIENTYTGSYGKAFRFHNSSNHTEIDSCDIRVISTNTSYGILLSSQYYASGGVSIDGLTVKNSTFNGGGNGIYLYGNSNTDRTKNILIQNNTFSNHSTYGLYFYNYLDSVSVINNDLSNFKGSSYGIYAYYVRDLELIKNTVVAGGNYAVYLNRINYIGGSSSNYCRVYNNMISQTGTSYAMYMYYAHYADIYFNSIRAEGSFACYSRYGNSKEIKNNIFYSGNNYAFYRNPTSTSYITSLDNNLYYRADNNANIAYDGGARTLTSWKTARTTWNQNSKEGNPKFIAKDDLRIANSKDADSLATPITGLTTDIFDTLRSTTHPDAGADEFDYQPIDGYLFTISKPTGMCLSANDTLEFGVINIGGDTIDLSANSIDIVWSLSGINSATGTASRNTGTLAPNDTVFIQAFTPTINMSSPGNYMVSAYITSTWDKYNENDSISSTYTRLATESFTVSNDTTLYYKDSIDISANFEFGKAEIVISEISQFSSSNGAPSGGRPGYMTTDDYIEISTSQPNYDLSGYKIEHYSSGAATPSQTGVLPHGAKSNSNGTLLLTGGTSSSPSNNLYALGYGTDRWSSGSNVGYVLKDPQGNVVDAVATNGASFNAASGVTITDWTGGTTGSSGGTHGIRRINGPDSNGPSNWVVSSSSNRQTPNVLNPNLGLKTDKPNGFNWSFNGVQVDTNIVTNAGTWATSGVKQYVARMISPCTGDTIRDTVSIQAFSKNLVLTANSSEYYSYPMSQTNGIDLSGNVKNLGDTMSNIRVFTTFAGASSGDTLVSNSLIRGANSSYDITNNGLTTTTGLKTIIHYLSTSDDFITDDTSKTNVDVTDSVMARENGNLPLNVSSASLSAFGQRFTVYTKDSITGAQIHIGNAFPGDKFKLTLYALQGNSVRAKMNESADYTIQSTVDTGLKTLRFNCLSVLSPGDYMLAMEKTSTVFSSAIGANQINATANAAFGKSGSSWIRITAGGSPFNMGLRLIFGSYDYPTFATLDPVCTSGDQFLLSGGMPTGGSYFGTGVSNDSLNPKLLTVGSNTISYVVANSLGCPDTIESTVEVKPEPVITSSFVQLTSCVSPNAKITVNATQAFGSLMYSVNNGSSFNALGVFDSLGSGSYTIVVKDSVCTVTDTTYVASPPGAPTKPNATGGSVYCKNDGLNKLHVSTTASGTKGVFKWYKDGALSQSHGVGDSIAPTDTVMTQVYYVIEDRLGCVSPADTTVVTINPLPVVSNASLGNRCTNADTITLATGSPSGGTYSGNGVMSGVFNPDSAGSGTHVITYSYTDGNNCTNTDTASVTIYQAPIVNYSGIDSSCTNAQPYALTGGTPTGGTYSGFGVSSGNFNPITAGLGLHTVQYKVTNTNCADSASAQIRVNLAPRSSFGSINRRCVDAASISLSTGAPSGGVYKGSGVSAGSFNPTVAGSGSHTLWYVYTDMNQCMDSSSISAQVDSLPNVQFASLANICENDTIKQLTQGTASPTGGTGTYFGTGVTNADFDPSIATAGAHRLGYAYVDANGCTDTAYSNQMVDTIPTVAWSGTLTDLCIDAAPRTLSGGMPSSGVYFGSGVVSSPTFRADSAKAGSHSLGYVYTDGNGCKDTARLVQVVNPLPVVRFSLKANWCLNDKPIELKSGMPVGGSYTVNGVTDTSYKSISSKVDTVTYTYTDTNRCTNSVTNLIKADTVPVVSFTSLNDVCINSGAINLVQGAPVGGYYTGNNVRSQKIYDPLVATTDSLMYHFVDSNNCADSAMQTITVNPLPVVSYSDPADICENTPQFALSGGAPTGGTYKGAGVTSGNNYLASNFGIGTDMITYVYVDGNNCTDSVTKGLRVHKVTLAKFNYVFPVCDNHDSIPLNTYGQPMGGVFKGSNVAANKFDPTIGAGKYTLTYVYTNAQSCQDSTTRDVEVEAAPQFSIQVIKNEGCSKNPPILATGLPNMTYRWMNGARTDTAEVRNNGKVWVKVTDPSTSKLCSTTDTISGVKYQAECVGMDEQLANTSVSYYPNPNQGEFFYQLEGFQGLDVNITIRSMSGQVVYEDKWEQVSDFHKGQINMEVLESGVYFIQLDTKKGSVMHKITMSK